MYNLYSRLTIGHSDVQLRTIYKKRCGLTQK